MIAPARQWMTAHPAWTAFFIALVIRAGYALRVGPVISPDSLSYHAAANAFRSSAFTSDPTFLVLPPVYPLFLALFPDDRVALAVQVGIGAAAAALMLRATARHFGARAGLLTGLLVAIQPTLVFWSTYILSDTIALTFYALALDLASLSLFRPRRALPALGGAVAGLLVLARAAFGLAMVPVLLAHAATRPRSRAIASFAAAGLIVLALPTARNAFATGLLSPYDSQIWHNLWIGTQWNEIGRATTGVDLVLPPELASASEAERQPYYKDVTLTFLRERPLDYVVLAAKKAVWYVLPVYPEWSTAHKIGIGGYLSALYAFGIVGALSLRRQHFTWLLVACAAAFVVTTMITFIDYDARYRIPFELTLAPLAAAGLVRLWRRGRSPGPSRRPAVA